VISSEVGKAIRKTLNCSTDQLTLNFELVTCNFPRVAALVLFVVGAACRGGAVPGPVEIRLVPPVGDGKAVIEVTHLPDDIVEPLSKTTLSREQFADILRVVVAEGQPAMLGEYAVADHALRFTPMFPLDPGRPYHVSFNAAAVPGGAGAGTAMLSTTVSIPAAAVEPSTVVSHVFPSGDSVPENQLRLYIHF
jgi:hypothetical protein